MTGSELIDSQSWWIGPEFLCRLQTEWPTTIGDFDNVEGANSELIKVRLLFPIPLQFQLVR